jgi:hypothetical protein
MFSDIRVPRQRASACLVYLVYARTLLSSCACAPTHVCMRAHFINVSRGCVSVCVRAALLSEYLALGARPRVYLSRVHGVHVWRERYMHARAQSRNGSSDRIVSSGAQPAAQRAPRALRAGRDTDRHRTTGMV